MGRVEMARHSCGTPPLLEDIAGAKHWDNMPDQGFTAHRSSVYKDGRNPDRGGHAPPQNQVRATLVCGDGLVGTR